MIIHAFIQARLGSTRLPGKVLLTIRNRPIVRLLCSALLPCRMIEKIVVCTPDKDGTEIYSFIGPTASSRPGMVASVVDETDLVGRFLDTLDIYPCNHFVRICADSPLIHPALIDLAVATHLAEGNKVTQLPGFPSGQQIQVYDVAHLRAAYPTMTPQQREHCIVPPMPKASINNKIKLTVDTQHDYEVIKAFMESLPKPHWEMTWPELWRAIKASPLAKSGARWSS